MLSKREHRYWLPGLITLVGILYDQATIFSEFPLAEG